MEITYPVPDSTTSEFVVAVDRVPADLAAIVPWRVGREFGKAAVAAFGTPRLQTNTFRAARSPLSPADLCGEEQARVRKARHHVVVSSTAPVSEQPRAVQVARALARSIAGAYHGLIVDRLTGAVVYHCPCCPGERQEFRVDDDWVGWAMTADQAAEQETSCSSCGPDGTRTCACSSVTTRGLRRFGLPEIVLAGAVCAHSLCAVNALRMVSQRLLTGHLDWLADNPGATSRTIKGQLTVDGCEFAVLSGIPDVTPLPPEESGFSRPSIEAGDGEALSVADRETAPAESPPLRTDSLAFGQELREGEPFHVRLTREGAGRSCLRVGPNVDLDGGDDDGLNRPSGLIAA